MSLARDSGNKSTEIYLIKQFKLSHIKGWLRHKSLVGKPDFVFQLRRLPFLLMDVFGMVAKNIVEFHVEIGDVSLWDTPLI
jgi:hypothetical protein